MLVFAVEGQCGELWTTAISGGFAPPARGGGARVDRFVSLLESATGVLALGYRARHSPTHLPLAHVDHVALRKSGRDQFWALETHPPLLRQLHAAGFFALVGV